MKGKKINKKSIFVVVFLTALLAISISVYSQTPQLPSNGLTHLWKFEGNADDSIGGLNGVVKDTSIVDGIGGGKAYNFDGEGDYVVIGGKQQQNESKSYSVSLWFKTTSTTRNDIFHVGKAGDCFYNPKIAIENGRIWASESTCNSDGRIGGRYFPGVPFKIGEWNNVVVTRDGQVVKFYLNGYLRITDTIQPPTLGSTDGRIVVGAGWNTNTLGYVNNFDGDIDEVAMWNRPLTDAEAGSIYKSVFPNTPLPLKVDVDYQNIESFPQNKNTFTDKYIGDSSWAVKQGSWSAQSGVLTNGNGPSAIGGDLLLLDSVQSSPGKTIRSRLSQGGDYQYTILYMGYQDINNTYYLLLDRTNKRIDIRRKVAGVADSIGLEIDFQKGKFYDFELRWVSPTKIQAEVWDENGNSLGVLERDEFFDWGISKDWTSGKFGLGAIQNGGSHFDDVKIGTIKSISPVTPTPTQISPPTQTPSPSTSQPVLPSPASSSSPTASPSESPSQSPIPTTTASPSITASPTQTPPPIVAQLSSPIKNTDLDNIKTITSTDADFLLSTVNDLSQTLDKQDKQFIISLPVEIADRGIAEEPGVQGKIETALESLFKKETNDELKTQLLNSINLLNTPESKVLLSDVLNDKLLGKCGSTEVYNNSICDEALSLASESTDQTISKIVDLIKFVQSSSNKEVVVNSINICNISIANSCQTKSTATSGYHTEVEIKNLGLDRQFLVVTYITDPDTGKLISRRSDADVSLKSGELKWVPLSDIDSLLTPSGKKVSVRVVFRDYDGYKSVIKGTYSLGENVDIGVPQANKESSYGISLAYSNSNSIESNKIIPISPVDASLYLTSSKSNHIIENVIQSLGAGNGIYVSSTGGDGTPENNNFTSNVIYSRGSGKYAAYLSNSESLSMTNDVLFSEDSYDLGVRGIQNLMLTNVTFRKDRVKLGTELKFDNFGLLNLVIKDADTGQPISNSKLSIKNKNGQTVLDEILGAGKKERLKVLRSTVRGVKRSPLTSKLSASTGDQLAHQGKRIYFQEILDDNVSTEEEDFGYTVNAAADGYQQSSASVDPSNTGKVEILLQKAPIVAPNEPEQKISDDPTSPDYVPPQPATQNPTNPVPSNTIASNSGQIIPLLTQASSNEQGISIDREVVSINLKAGDPSQVTEKINIMNTGNKNMSLAIHLNDLNQLSVTPDNLEVEPGQQKSIVLSGKVSNLVTGVYPGKISLSNSDGSVQSEISVVITVQPAEKLFDLLLDFDKKKTAFFAGDPIPFSVKIINVAGNPFDINLGYRLKDFTGNVMGDKSERVTGGPTVTLSKDITTGPDIKAGSYIIESSLKNDKNEVVAVAAITAYINTKASSAKGRAGGGISLPLGTLAPIIIIIVIVALLGLKFFVLGKKKRR